MTPKAFSIKHLPSGQWLSLELHSLRSDDRLTTELSDAWVSFEDKAVATVASLELCSEWSIVERPDINFSVLMEYASGNIERGEASKQLKISQWVLLLLTRAFDLMNDLTLPFEFNRTFGLCQQGANEGNYEFEWNDANKQVLIHGDRINPAFLKSVIETPQFGPYHSQIKGLSANSLYIDPSYTLFAEIRGQFFRVDRIEGGDVVLVYLDPK